MKSLCITCILVLVGLVACDDDDFNDCAEVGDRSGRGLIAKCGDFPEHDAGGGTGGHAGTGAAGKSGSGGKSGGGDEDAAVADEDAAVADSDAGF